MEYSTSLEYQVDSQILNRQFRCPCGKCYMSYSALFIHIKNKHLGQTPGLIKKTQVVQKKRGRPVTKFKTPIKKANPQEDISLSLSLCQSKSLILTDQDCITRFVSILKQSNSAPLNKTHLNEITAFVEMNVFLLTKNDFPQNVHLGDVMAQFLQIMSKRSTWEQFQQIYILLVVFIQFIIDELNNSSVIATGPIDLLCDYINDFIQIGVDGMIKEYEISNTPVFHHQTMISLFQVFFQWLMAKGYTKYRITVNNDFKKIETQDIL